MNPLFVVGGDLNKRDLAPAFEDFIDMTEIDHGPTRGREKLDISFTNFAPELIDTRICDPLENVPYLS